MFFIMGYFEWVLYLTVFEIKTAPCVHDFNAGCTILTAVHQACTLFSLIFSVYILVYVHLD